MQTLLISDARIFLALLIALLVRGALTTNPHPPSGFDWLPGYEFHQTLPPPLALVQSGYRLASPIASPPPQQVPQEANLHVQPADSTNVLNWPSHMMPPAGGLVPNTNPTHLRCKFPKGTFYRTLSLSSRALRNSACTNNDWVVIVPRRPLHSDITFLVPKGSKIEISGNTVEVPAEIRKVDEKEVVITKELCEKNYERDPRPESELEPLDIYVIRCSDINFWNIRIRNFEDVPVAVKKDLVITVSGDTWYHVPPSGRRKKCKPTRTRTKGYRVALTPKGNAILIPEGSHIRISDDPASDDPNRIRDSSTGDSVELRIIDKENVKIIKKMCEAVHDGAKRPGWNREAVDDYMSRCSDENFENFPGGFVYVPVNYRRSTLRRN